LIYFKLIIFFPFDRVSDRDSEEDNKMYLEFLEYCEERRQDVKRSRDEDDARKGEAMRKQEA
jgi:hypothetical protein